MKIRAVLMTATVAALALGSPADAAEARGGYTNACVSVTGVTATCALKYGSGPRHTLDLFRPVGVANPPVVVMIPGGAWTKGERAKFNDQAKYYAANGLAAVTIDYTLATDSNPSWPEIESDVETAAAWLKANGARYGFDGTRIGAYGGSGGGHVAGILGTSNRADVIATVTLSGPMDLTLNDGSARKPAAKMLGCSPTPAACPETAAEASPAHRVDPGDSQFLLFNSQDEGAVRVTQAQAMAASLASAGVPHELEILAGSLHGTAYLCSMADGQRVIDKSFTYLATRLGAADTTSTGFC